MNSETLEIVLSVAVPAFLLLLSWCAKLLTEIIRAKAEEIKKKTDNETIKTYIDIVSENAVNVVETLNQTVITELKAKNEDGKLSTSDAIHIKNTAVEMLANTLSTDIKDVIGTVFNDTEAYLNNVIEKTVVAVKKNMTSKK